MDGNRMNDPVSQRESGNRYEHALIERVAKQDRDALGTLYRIYHPRIFKFVFRMTRSYGVAEELVNDTMLAVWRSASSFRGESKVSTWILGIAYRQSMRRVSKKKMTLTPFAETDGVVVDADNVEKQDWVQRGLSELPEAQQLTVILVFYLGLSYEEAARVAECPVNTVKTRMFHAKKKLKVLLEKAADADSNLNEK